MSTLGVASGGKISTVTFEIKITSGYGQTFNNTARVKGIAIDENDQNVLVSKEVTEAAVAISESPVVPSVIKSVQNLTSHDGKNYVGDTLKYSIVVSNKALNSSIWQDITLL
ncbi:hypothetical protein [endosymbiont 'TC1' of Trimyema compressum]|uniref:hypothetical protein n=1 Tax=endosymbiont 'TC1' of Trimyema compressum TaxID=243899 RepID=UPI0013924794|nr:hypothetical protein [endosymbiont 'TC1' of Trimyema compressum]